MNIIDCQIFCDIIKRRKEKFYYVGLGQNFELTVKLNQFKHDKTSCLSRKPWIMQIMLYTRTQICIIEQLSQGHSRQQQGWAGWQQSWRCSVGTILMILATVAQVARVARHTTTVCHISTHWVTSRVPQCRGS